MSTGREHVTPASDPEVARTVAAVAAPTPAAPVPLPAVGTMVVGHAEDRAEADADRMADVALARLSAAEGSALEAHQHGPGCDHLRRTPAPSGSPIAGPGAGPVVGYEGGALDPTTSDAITSRRGTGKPLDGDVRRRMETAFGTSLSGVRIHADDTAARLNTAVSARAFTTGNDVFFGKGEYSPTTPGGERVLAHEIAHTLQPAGSVHRLLDGEKEGPDAESEQESGASAVTGPFPILTGFAGVPQSMRELLQCNDDDITRLAAMTTVPQGGLMTVLKSTFEADWFRAKACLVFGKWPSGGTPNFSHDASLTLMTGLTVLRGKVHEAVKPLAQAGVKQELRTRAEQLKGNTKLGDRLTMQRGLSGNDQVEFKGSVGADTVTSDVDVSTGGENSEVAVRAYNEAFRAFLDGSYDPGTVFDLNVYAKDFIHGFTKHDTEDAGAKVIKPQAENAAPSAAQASERDREQDIWALVHVSRYMPSDDDWASYVAGALRGLSAEQRADQEERLATARRRSKGFEWRLLSMMEHLCTTLDLGLGKTSAWSPGDDAAFKEGALKMRAANKLYEDKLLQVKELRTDIEALRRQIETQTAPPDAADRLSRLIGRLDGELSMAQLYANEVYGSGGATVHAVIGMQLPKKLSTAKVTVTAKLPKQQLYASFNDNLGDVLKDFEHYGKAGHGEPDYWYAAFKMGKYANRMVDCAKQLSDGSPDDLITPTDQRLLLAHPNLVALAELSGHHLKEKDAAGGKDPVTLKDHPYFGTMTKSKLEGLRTHAIRLGAFVRSLAARKGPASEVPDRPVRGADITPEQLERAAADVKRALAKAMRISAEAAGPGH